MAAGTLGSCAGPEGPRMGRAKGWPKKGSLLQQALPRRSPKLLQIGGPRRHLMCECKSCPDPPASVSLAPVSPNQKWLRSCPKAAPTTAFSRFCSEKTPAEEPRRTWRFCPCLFSCFGIPENKKHQRNGRHYSNDGDKFN